MHRGLVELEVEESLFTGIQGIIYDVDQYRQNLAGPLRRFNQHSMEQNSDRNHIYNHSE